MDALLDGCLTRTGHGSIPSSVPASAFWNWIQASVGSRTPGFGSSPRWHVFSSPLSSSTLQRISVFSRPLTSFGVSSSASCPWFHPCPVPGFPSCISGVLSGLDFTFCFCVHHLHFWGRLHPRWHFMFTLAFSFSFQLQINASQQFWLTLCIYYTCMFLLRLKCKFRCMWTIFLTFLMIFSAFYFLMHEKKYLSLLPELYCSFSAMGLLLVHFSMKVFHSVWMFARSQQASQPTSQPACYYWAEAAETDWTDWSKYVKMWAPCQKRMKSAAIMYCHPRPLFIMLNKHSFGIWWLECRQLRQIHIFSSYFYYLVGGVKIQWRWSPLLYFGMQLPERKNKTSNISSSIYIQHPRMTKWKQNFRFCFDHLNCSRPIKKKKVIYKHRHTHTLLHPCVTHCDTAAGILLLGRTHWYRKALSH